MSSPPLLPWRYRTTPERLILLFVLCGAPFVALHVSAYYLKLHAHHCAWKSVTHLPCAGCGGTRALAALADGSLLDALAWNPGAVFASLAATVAGLYAACVLIFRLEPWRPKLPAGAWMRAAVVFLIVANWVYLLWAGRS